MNDQATVETLAPEAPADLGALYDQLTADPAVEETPETPEETPAAPVEEVKAEEPAEVIPEAPGNLPKAVRDHWQALTPDARDALAKSQLEMATKLSEQGRLIGGIAPIRDVLVKAAQEMPHLAQLRPEQVAEQVMDLARIGQRMQADPAKTLMELAERHGVQEQLKAALGGVEAPAAAGLQAKIAQLEQTITRLSNPEYIRSQATAAYQETATLNEVQQFAATADHWAELEERIPSFIPIVQAKLGPNASPRDVLQAAYTAAKDYFMPEPKATQASVGQTPAPSPEKAAEVLKAKSVNVTGEVGRGRVLTQAEELSAIYDRAYRK